MYKCLDKCCTIHILPYKNQQRRYYNNKRKRDKAGVFFFDKTKNKVLLVQSRGNLWGLPKGTFEEGETKEECAIREVKEETGISVSKAELTKFCCVKGHAYYYYIEMEEIDVNVQDKVKNNDANGIGWINCNCLIKLVKNGYLKLNHHTRIAFKEFLKLSLPSSTYNPKLIK